MKIKKYSEMENLVRNASEGTVLAVAGPDLYQSGLLRSAIVSKFRKTFDYEILRYESADLGEGDLKRHLLENSLFSSGRLIVLSDTHKLCKASASELFDAIEAGLSDSALFLSSPKVPREAAILRKLEKTVPVLTCHEPYDRDMPGWVKKFASQEDISLKSDAVQLLTEYSGRNLRRLSDAITKLAIYYGPGTRVDRSSMMEVISGKGSTDIFHLGDMIFGNRRGEAVDTAISLLRFGEEPVVIISYVFSLWQKVIRAIEIVGSGKSSKEVSAATGARYPLLEKLMKFSRTASKVDPVDAAEAFAEADYGLKTGSDSLVTLTRLIFTLTNGH